MPTQHKGYFLQDGTRVPSVTTILHSWVPGGPNQLMGWAAKMTREGKDFNAERDKAADAGTLAHGAMESWAKGEEPVWDAPDEIVAKAKRSFGAFLEWAEQTQFKITHTEQPLISEKYRYGGTFDAAMMNSRRVLADYKTSNSIRAQYLAQVGGGYGILWEENFPDDPIEGGYLMLRFDRTYGDFSHKWFPELDSARRAFLLMREMYDLEKELMKRAQ